MNNEKRVEEQLAYIRMLESAVLQEKRILQNAICNHERRIPHGRKGLFEYFEECCTCKMRFMWTHENKEIRFGETKAGSFL